MLEALLILTLWSIALHIIKSDNSQPSQQVQSVSVPTLSATALKHEAKLDKNLTLAEGTLDNIRAMLSSLPTKE